MPSDILRKNSRPYQILKTLALCSGFLILSSISPLSGAKIVHNLIEQYIRKRKFEKQRFLRDLKHLQSRRLIQYKELPDGNLEIILNKLGKENLLRYKIDEIKLKKEKWDGLWRMIIFDIPHHQKQARDALRRKLNSLEFYSLQKSVFITPHECENEIDFIGSFFGVRNCILILYVKKFEGEEKLKHHFGI